MKMSPRAPALRRPVPLTLDTSLIDRLPSAVLVCDAQAGLILHANPSALAALAGAGSGGHGARDQIVGTTLPELDTAFGEMLKAVARRALPWSHAVVLGDQNFQFTVDIMDVARGRSAYLLAAFTPLPAVQITDTAHRLRQMVDNMPINVMTCGLGEFRIDYANKASISTLRRIEQYLPITADQLVGSSIDVFHKDPGRVRVMLSDPRNLPHTARIKAGPETLDLRISAITDANGTYVGPMLTWDLMTESIAIAQTVRQVVSDMGQTSEAVQSSSESLLSLTERSQTMAGTVSSAAVEMSASFDEISNQLSRASTTSREMATKAGSTDSLVSGLVGSVERISNVTALIDKIASQTNLLALNATIEAARVGEAGRGFAVVAQEVKALAVQTANATKDIREQVAAVQSASTSAASAVSEININIAHLSEVFTAISAGMEEQAVTNRSVSESIVGVSTASSQIREAARDVSHVASEVSGFAELLNKEMDSLLNRRS